MKRTLQARRLAAGLSFLTILLASAASAQDEEKRRLKERLNDIDPVGSWYYDDIDAAYAEARDTGKPLMVVFR